MSSHRSSNAAAASQAVSVLPWKPPPLTSSTTSITGTFYFAGALLNISGNGGVVNLGSQYISYDLTLGGNGNININWTPYTVARKRSIYLVE